MPEGNQGITQTDLTFGAIIFNQNDWAMPQRYFRYLAAQDKWELLRVQPNGNITLVATRDSTGEWVEA